jgi:predicted GNAT superfamily acetyltransferase
VASDAFDIRLLTRADEMRDVVALFDQVWGSATELVPIQLLTAIAHAGGYVSAAFDTSDGDERIVGASAGILARHHGRPALHSHITGLLPGAQGTGLGREIKLHQRAWAAEHDIDWVVWTFDPLVRRNAWFNLVVLGAEVHEYLPNFYGVMHDAINAGDESDRLLMAWPVGHGDVAHGEPVDGAGCELVPTPDDVVALRRTDPAAVARWRRDVRTALAGAIGDGRSVIGLTRDGAYAIGAR